MTRPAGQPCGLPPRQPGEVPGGRPALTRPEREQLAQLVSDRLRAQVEAADRARWAKGSFRTRYRKPL